jgi:hypothetical protein
LVIASSQAGSGVPQVDVEWAGHFPEFRARTEFDGLSLVLGIRERLLESFFGLLL